MTDIKQLPRVSQKIHAIDLLHPENIIGYNNELGTYSLFVQCTDGTNEERKLTGIGKTKFILDKSVNENYMRFSFVSYHLKHLMGEILTTVEASIQNEKQCEAVKSIVRSYFSRKLDWIYENCACPEEEQDYLMSSEE